jgi:serine O-acetyltransferase
MLISDFKRYGYNKISFGRLFFVFISHPIPGLKFITIFRMTQKYRRKNRLLFFFFFLWLRRLKVKYGIDISYRTQIGKGFYIGHFGNIVIHGDTIIGENCNVSQGITIGVSNYGKKRGVPIIGDKVFVGSRSIIKDNVSIGACSIVGAGLYIKKNLQTGSLKK